MKAIEKELASKWQSMTAKAGFKILKRQHLALIRRATELLSRHPDRADNLFNKAAIVVEAIEGKLANINNAIELERVK